ncbi:MAG: hypothetical protein COC17_00215 [Hyphomicrobiales bacterium]|nr:DUF3237 domain-containing protein [Hyphomicrobiales bacterium]PCH51555.1 MAG: hypothetical protein COC17_00215 [Hyphomicrobiales bacterium]
MTTHHEPKLAKPELEHICDLTVELGPIREMGNGRAGNRRIIPIIGGTVSGPRLQGKILDIGADWQTIFHGGLAELDTRYAMETHDGAIIEIINFGYRFGAPEILAALARGEDVAPDTYSMRTMAKLETGDERYEWVNKTLFVGTGARQKSAVIVSLFAVQ